MSDVLFLSRIIPKKYDAEIRKKMKNTMDDASISWQERLINGLDQVFENHISLLNLLPIKSWPRGYSDAFVKSFSFCHNGDSKDYNVGFCNVVFLKRLFQKIPFVNAVKKWARKNQNEEKIIISFTLYPEFLEAVKIAKSIDPNIKTAAIVLDLPEYCILTKNISLISKVYLKWSRFKANKLLKYVDYGFFLTEDMINDLGFKGQSLIIEGISTKIPFEKIEVKKDRNTIFVTYAGTLHKRFGVLHLIESFQNIKNPNFCLQICGYGDSINEILEACKKDKRIKYYGQMPRNKILRMLVNSDVIVNPRQNNEAFVKYSFPSKNIEALSAGVPLVAYKLPGIPSEYDCFINYVENNDLASAIVEVGSDVNGVFKARALMAKEWVLKEKNEYVQAKRIKEMVTKQYDKLH